jgi:putative molybdopterin biosynthesis protein
MDETYLYQQIAETIRRDILEGRIKPGERLPSVRGLREQWNCTPGTIQRAYSELAREGLIISQAGRGTQVAGNIPKAKTQAQETLRRANLVHHSEAFLLEAMTAGYDLPEIQSALDLAMDRWRTLDQNPSPAPVEVIRFIGSHDMVINGLAHHYFGVALARVSLHVSFSGSMGGLIALAEGKADLCGCHLWDAESDTYNVPFIRKTLPEIKVSVITLAHRRLGLVTAPGNPLKIYSLSDLARPEVRFVNRQSGSGTRVWLDSTLETCKILPKQILGYRDERSTHSDVARAIAEGNADAGLALETAAAAFGLDFTLLTRERYDLVMLAETAQRPSMQQFIGWLQSSEAKNFVSQYTGYENSQTGMVQIL